MDWTSGDSGSDNVPPTPLIRRASAESTRSHESYDLNADTVADGFRPAVAVSAAPVDSLSPSSPDANDDPVGNSSFTSEDASAASAPSDVALPSSSLAVPSSKNHPSMLNRPSSVSKPHRTHDSLTLHNDGSSSTAGSGSLMGMASPYQGASQPSHPYQMYTQRTLSNDSSSTPARRSLEGGRAPTHPYSLYPQNTVSGDVAQESQITVGFGGMGGPYQRQVGPDGEDNGDLIGPLGHLEQLPPYTRYPPEAHGRPVGTFDTPSVPVSPLSPDSAVDGVGGIDMATRDPEPSSPNVDLTLSRSRPSVRTATSNASRPESNDPPKPFVEDAPLSKWQRRARKKAWGIVPYWAICLLVCGLVLVGIVMGAVIGTMLAKDDNDEYDDRRPSPPSKLTTLPPDTDELVTGRYLIPPLTASQAPRECIEETLLREAWNCEMPSRYYTMDIESIPEGLPHQNYTLSLFAINDTSSEFIWGTQPPDIQTPEILSLVNDTFEIGKGPAWWLKFTYEKVVIVPEDELAPLSSRRKRDNAADDTPFEGFDPTRFQKQSVGAVDGDTPWICTWPETTLEIYIYPDQNVSTSTTTTTPEGGDGSEGGETSEGADTGVQQPLQAYPKVVKFLERRYDISDDSEAYCRQVIIQGYDAIDKTDENNDPITIKIDEDNKPWTRDLSSSMVNFHPRSMGPSSQLHRRKAQELTDCGCLWWS